MRFQLVFITLICCLVNGFSQKNIEYNGEFKLFNEFGNAKYYYTIQKPDTLKNKDFYFEKNFISQDSLQTVNKLIYKGFYNNGIKSKTWTFNFLKLHQSGTPFVNSDVHIAYPSNGTIYTINAEFNNGEPNGKWVVWSSEIKNSEVKDTIFNVSAQLKGGKIINLFEAKDINTKVLFKVNEAGLLSGDYWFTDDYKKNKEYRLYEDGVLKEHWVEENQKKQILISQNNNLDTLFYQTIPLDSMYLIYSKFLSITNVLKNNMYEKVFTNNLKVNSYLKSLNQFNNYDLWVDGASAKPILYPLIKLPVYPLTENEKKSILNIFSNYNQTQKLLNGFLNNTNIDYYHHISRDIAKAESILTELEKIHFILNPVVNFINSPVLHFFNRSSTLKSLLPSITFNKNIQYEFNDTIQKLNFNFYAFSSYYRNELEHLDVFFKKLKDSVENISKKVEPIIKKLDGQTQLSSKENQLLLLNDSISWLFSSKNTLKTYNSYHQIFEVNMVNFSKSILKKYVNLELEGKIENLDEYLNCLNEIISFYNVLSKLPSDLKRLDELYTRIVFNPYTITDMEERVKDKVFSYFELVVLPEVFKEFNMNQDCNSFYIKVANLEKLYRQMVVLRDRDTKDLERLIRKNESQKEIFEMFNVKLDFN